MGSDPCSFPAALSAPRSCWVRALCALADWLDRGVWDVWHSYTDVWHDGWSETHQRVLPYLMHRDPFKRGGWTYRKRWDGWRHIRLGT